MIDPRKVFLFEPHAPEEVRWLVPENCPYMEGHFPGHPVLPAIGLIDGSLEFLRACGVAITGDRLSLKRAKFAGLVTPGKQMILRARAIENRWTVDWIDGPTTKVLASLNFCVS